MTKAKREINTQVVAVDSTALFSADKGPAVHPDFDRAWAEHQSIAKLQLVVPEIVRGEIVFQHTHRAVKAWQSVRQQAAELEKITGLLFPVSGSEEEFRKAVEAKFDRWASEKGARIAPTPYAKISWPDVCEAAVWRRPPFTRDPAKEKGFRDALILESIAEHFRSEDPNCDLVWISEDTLLRETAKSRFQSDSRVRCFEDMTSYFSLLKLTKERLDKDFISIVLERAKTGFYSAGSSQSVFHSAVSLAKAKFKPDEMVPPPGPFSFVGAGTPTGPGRWAVGSQHLWTPVSQNLSPPWSRVTAQG